ncbi:radical SAM protein [Oscillospiraceae bacterium HV4-5-C5C]|nr:radical SAM protein [Oscillospiraceae bacterium HV4-5-C5C]
MTVTDKIKQTAAMKAFDYVVKDPEQNLPKLLDTIIKLDDSDSISKQLDTIKTAYLDKAGNWRQLIDSVMREVDPGEIRRMFQALAVNDALIGGKHRKEYMKKYNCNIPTMILMDPTSACNLRCTGCWAAEYGHQLNLTLDDLEDVIRQGEEFGCYIYLYSGGEPLMRKKDLITLCERHPECGFLAFTNATQIDEAFADEMLRVGNFLPAISVEGFEEETDFRRGKGTFKAVMKAMEILRRKKLAFGISCCYTSKNAEFIGSEEYFDAMVSWGAKFCWFFTYMPIGKAAVPELMATAEQRKYMYEQVRKFRATKPLFTIDFWNDGEYIDGCIAGGRCYLHINAEGDIEPCGFIHYADSNIHTDRLLDAFQKPLFMGYHDNQPFNKNQLRPCPVLDNPGRLTSIVARSNAKSTDIMDTETAKEYSDKCVERARAWAPVAKDIWENSARGQKTLQQESAAESLKKQASVR